MEKHKRIIQTIYAAIDEVNKMRPEKQQLDKSTDTIILDSSLGKLDSLGLLNLTVITEEKIEAEFGIAISLTNENALLQGASIFKTIGMLADYISSILEEK